MTIRSVAAVLGFGMGAAAAAPDAARVPLAETPPAVQATLAKAFAGRGVETITRDERNDFVYFRVTFAGGKEPREVTLRETGEVETPPPRAGE